MNIGSIGETADRPFRLQLVGRQTHTMIPGDNSPVDLKTQVHTILPGNSTSRMWWTDSKVTPSESLPPGVDTLVSSPPFECG